VVDHTRCGDRRADSTIDDLYNLENPLAALDAGADAITDTNRARGFSRSAVDADMPAATTFRR
jgi:hypothetical protein